MYTHVNYVHNVKRVYSHMWNSVWNRVLSISNVGADLPWQLQHIVTFGLSKTMF